MNLRAATFAVWAVAISTQSYGQGVEVKPSHPYVGVWKVTLKSTFCTETHDVRPDGTTRVTSGDEIGESRYQISKEPDSNGIYDLVDTVTKSNGRRSCSGDSSVPGQKLAGFVAFDKSFNAMVLCLDRTLQRCMGPFVRQ